MESEQACNNSSDEGMPSSWSKSKVRRLSRLADLAPGMPSLILEITASSKSEVL